MISSPCKECPLRDQPKVICSKNCELLHSVQEVLISISTDNVMSASGYSDTDMFPVNHTGYSGYYSAR